MNQNDMTTPTPPKQACAIIEWKDPDFPQVLTHWGRWSEYFKAEVMIDPKTGKGTIQLIQQ